MNIKNNSPIESPRQDNTVHTADSPQPNTIGMAHGRVFDSQDIKPNVQALTQIFEKMIQENKGDDKTPSAPVPVPNINNPPIPQLLEQVLDHHPSTPFSHLTIPSPREEATTPVPVVLENQSISTIKGDTEGVQIKTQPKLLDTTFCKFKIGMGTHSPSFQDYISKNFPIRGDFEALRNHANTLQDPQAKRAYNNDLMNWHMTQLALVFSIDKIYNIANRSSEEFSGNQAYISVSWIANANLNYFMSDDAKTLLKADDREKLIEMSLSAVDYCFASECNDEGNEKITDRILDDLKNDKPVTISTGWHKHQVNITIYEDILVYINKGNHENPDVAQKIYRMGKDFKSIDSNKLLDEMTPREVIWHLTNYDLYTEKSKKGQIDFIEKEMHAELDLKELTDMPKVPQKMGNCTYANDKAGVQGAAFALEYKRIEGDATLTPEKKIESAKNYANIIFKNIEMQDRVDTFKTLLSLEPLVVNKEVDLPPEIYYSLISAITDKLSRVIDTEKGSKNNTPEIAGAQNYEQYKTGLYRHTAAARTVDQFREVAEKGIAQSNLPLAACGVFTTSKSISSTLAKSVIGSFVFSKENCTEFYLYTNQQKGEAPLKLGPFSLQEDGSLTYKNEKNEAVNYKTLSDLMSDFKKPEVCLLLPCQPQIVEGSKVLRYFAEQSRKDLAEKMESVVRKSNTYENNEGFMETLKKITYSTFTQKIDTNLSKIQAEEGEKGFDLKSLDTLSKDIKKDIAACEKYIAHVSKNLPAIFEKYEENAKLTYEEILKDYLDTGV